VAARACEVNQPDMENIGVGGEGVTPEAVALSGEAEGARAETGLRDRTVYMLVALLAIGFAFWWTQFSTPSICCGDFDGYYHFRWSRLLYEGMRSGHFPPPFEALPLTTLNPQDYVDHHFLFHVLQIPFTFFADAERAAWAVLLVCLLLSPLAYLHALRLIRAGHRHFVAGLTSAAVGLVVVAAMLGVSGGALEKAGASVVIVAAIALCGWLTTRLLAKGRARPVAALAALAVALVPPMAFYRATLFYQSRAVEFFADDPYANFQYGAKLGTWLFATAALLSCFWLVVRHRLRYPLVWLAALMACSTPFYFRMSMGKAMSVSIVLLVAGVHLLFRRKYLWLLPLAYVFALTYDMVFLLCAAAFFWLCANVWAEDWEVASKPVLWAGAGLLLVVAGTALGFVVNPYFPHNVVLMYQHMAMKITAQNFSTAVGGEWYPYTTWEFVWNGFVACAAMVVGYVAFKRTEREATARALFFLLFSTFLMLVNLRWKRFSEYWPPFAVLFVAFALQPYLVRREEKRSEEAGGRFARWFEPGLAALAAIGLAVPAALAAFFASQEISGMARNTHYLGGMEWVRRNVPEGEMIFNTDWDAFPKIFFYAPHHRYVTGLDPTYLLDRDKALFDAYSKVLGDEPDPGPIIRERFNARYVFTHPDRARGLMRTGWFDQPYADDDCVVLRVRDERYVSPPPEREEDEDLSSLSGRRGDPWAFAGSFSPFAREQRQKAVTSDK
jgi:hypothetical protein